MRAPRKNVRSWTSPNVAVKPSTSASNKGSGQVGLKKVKKTNGHRGGAPASASSLKQPAKTSLYPDFSCIRISRDSSRHSKTLWLADFAQYAGTCVNNDGYVLLTIA
jgi:hypothetical protein